ncbi:flavodoxin family protein [Rummeliibacillus sp. JY-2-4R]
MKITAFIGSTRVNGNAELLTDIVMKGIRHDKIYLKELNIQPIHDLRHDVNGFQPVDDDYDQIVHALIESDLLIFSTPVYWYTMSGLMKNMIDRISQTMRDDRYPTFREQLKTKSAIVVTVGGDDPNIKALPLIQTFKYTFDFLNMKFPAYIIGEGHRPGDITQDNQTVTQAKLLNERLKTVKSVEEL